MTTVRVIDFETTGTEPPDAEVCEVGTVDVNVEGRFVGIAGSTLCTVRSMPPDVRAVHHISKEECDPFPPFEASMLGMGDVDCLAAHNADFELKFFRPEKPVICTYKTALRIWPDAPGHGNGTLRYWLQDKGLIEPVHEYTMPPHRAGPDAYVTAHILIALLNAGVTGREMVAWTKEPAVLPTCPIGKFRGKPWSEVETGFLDWMTRQATMEADLKWNAQRELDRRIA